MDDPQAYVERTDAGETSASPAQEAKRQRTPEEQPGGDMEVGGPQGPEPTRYGDWERKGRCIDF
jgi:hypothetical protein